MILLDTDILTRYYLGHPRVLKRVQASVAKPATTIISRIEVLQGRFASVLKADDVDQLLQAQDRLELAERELAKFEIVPVRVAAGTMFRGLCDNKKLKKIGRADLLIASIALAHGATLVTRNLRHFRQVQGLRLENWVD